MITTISVGGVPVDLGEVLADEVSVLHGRAAVDDGPSASSATLRLLVADTMPTWMVGDPVAIGTAAGALFTGTLTDRRISRHVDTVERGRVAVFELTAIGPVATLGRRVVGDEPWPQESASVRAGRILTLAGVPHEIEQAIPDPLMLPRDVDARTGLDLITGLAADTGAAVVDLPDGTVLYQPLQARSRPQFYYRWMDFDPAFTWAGFDAALTWAGFDIVSPASEQPVELPAGAVGWEPEWVSTASMIVNSVRVGYGDPGTGADQATVSLEDQPSIDRMGKRYAYLGTQLATSADATARASHIISTQARERWALGSVDVYADALTEPLQNALYGLRCGDWVLIPGLPQPAPAMVYSAICEGWAYREWVTSETRHAAWTLALSDPIASLAVMTWADFPPAHRWQDFPPLLTWDSITDLASIGAA